MLWSVGQRPRWSGFIWNPLLSCRHSTRSTSSGLRVRATISNLSTPREIGFRTSFYLNVQCVFAFLLTRSGMATEPTAVVTEHTAVATEHTAVATEPTAEGVGRVVRWVLSENRDGTHRSVEKYTAKTTEPTAVLRMGGVRWVWSAMRWVWSTLRWVLYHTCCQPLPGGEVRGRFYA